MRDSNFSQAASYLTATPLNPFDYENIHVGKLLCKAKSSVYLAYSPTYNRNYALKVFVYDEEKPHRHFRNEVRFHFLSHPNVIKFTHVEEQTFMPYKGKEKQISCILMEYAPYGNFFDFLKMKPNMNEKLIRTYFRQLIDGLEYLHSKGVWHLDVKPDNLLLGDDFKLKIADFDLSYMKGDIKIVSKGTRYFRAPELKAGQCKNVGAADVYAAGLILFILKCEGVVPHVEDGLYQGIDLFRLLNTNSQRFFRMHSLIQGRDLFFFDLDFKELFLSMVRFHPDDRVTIPDIKKSKWYNGTNLHKG